MGSVRDGVGGCSRPAARSRVTSEQEASRVHYLASELASSLGSSLVASSSAMLPPRSCFCSCILSDDCVASSQQHCHQRRRHAAMRNGRNDFVRYPRTRPTRGHTACARMRSVLIRATRGRRMHIRIYSAVYVYNQFLRSGTTMEKSGRTASTGRPRRPRRSPVPPRGCAGPRRAAAPRPGAVACAQRPKRACIWAFSYLNVIQAQKNSFCIA